MKHKSLKENSIFPSSSSILKAQVDSSELAPYGLYQRESENRMHGSFELQSKIVASFPKQVNL